LSGRELAKQLKGINKRESVPLGVSLSNLEKEGMKKPAHRKKKGKKKNEQVKKRAGAQGNADTEFGKKSERMCPHGVLSSAGE